MKLLNKVLGAALRLQGELATAREEARTDPATRLGNRRAWEERIATLLASGEPFAVVLFDVANLKAANTALGHFHVDEVLIRRIAGVLRASEGMRLRGDEFAVLLPGRSVQHARLVRDRLEREVGRVELAPGVSTFLVGEVFEFPQSDRTFLTCLTETDFAVEERKLTLKRAAGEATTRLEALTRLFA